MAWVQNINPPNKRKLEFTIQDFAGGLNNRTNSIEPNQASDLLNMAFTYQDVLEKRKGFTPFNAQTLPAPITHMDLYKPYHAEDELITATDTEVYADGVKIADVQGTIDTANFQGLLFFCDGDSLYAYGQHNTTTSTYVDIIGTIPDSYTALKVVNPPEGYTPLDEIHTRGKTVYNYTNGTVHYEPCVNELDDVYLGANLQSENPRYIVVHKGRLFVSGDKKDNDNVYITDISTPFYFAVALPIQLPPTSDKVKGMIVWDDAVVIGREYDMYRIIGETSNPELGFSLFELRQINTHTGIANNRCLTPVHNYLFFLGSDGIAYALGTTHMDNRLLATQIISSTLDLFKHPINATPDTIRSASAVFDDEFWYVNIGDKTLVYSYRHKAWSMYDYVDMNAPLYYYDKVIWGRNDGRIVEFGDNYLDDGRPIYAFWQSKAYDMDEATRYKQFREFYLVSEAFDDSDSDVRVTFEVDYADVRNAITVENKIAFWGKAKFGDRFIDRNINASVPFVIGRRARYMRFRYANGHRIEGSVPTVIDLLDVPKKYNYMSIYVDETASYHYYENGKWIELSDEEINQPMRIYELNGDYELKGRR